MHRCALGMCMKNKIYNILHYKLCPPISFLWVSACPMPSLSIEDQLQGSAGGDREMKRQRDASREPALGPGRKEDGAVAEHFGTVEKRLWQSQTPQRLLSFRSRAGGQCGRDGEPCQAPASISQEPHTPSSGVPGKESVSCGRGLSCWETEEYTAHGGHGHTGQQDGCKAFGIARGST